MTAALGLRARSIRLQVRLTPKGGRDAIDGWSKDSAGRRLLKARVAAPPEDGKANRALIVLMADALDVKKGDITIVSGETSRMKVLEISGDTNALRERVERLGAAD